MTDTPPAEPIGCLVDGDNVIWAPRLINIMTVATRLTWTTASIPTGWFRVGTITVGPWAGMKEE